MMKKIVGTIVLLSSIIAAKDYSKQPEVDLFMSHIASKYQISKKTLLRLFADVSIQESALKTYLPMQIQKTLKKGKKNHKTHGSWDRYVRKKVTPMRIKQGIDFIKRYQKIFNAAEAKYGVPKEYIAAIIGIESVYGANVGRYPVFDTLSTLAFEKNRRNAFFKKQLEAYLHLVFSQGIDPKKVYGSYAGAIGIGQFMPSNYDAYGVDMDGDGKVSLQKIPDAIGSIAYYLNKNGWRKGESVATRVSYEGWRYDEHKTGYRHTYDPASLTGITPKDKSWHSKKKVRLIKLDRYKYDELWFGTKNFFVITRYNHSSYYAMAVHQLAQKIKQGLEGED